MTTFICVVIGGLFLFKMAYVLSAALLLPITKGALYVSTSRLRIATLLDALPMEKGQVLIDLGCGDGRVLRMARQKYQVRAIGYELNPLAYLKAKILCCGKKEIQVRHSNFWKADLSDADVVFCYLFPDLVKKLSVKLASELNPGATIVSCNFSLPGFSPSKILRPDNSVHNDPIYIYQLKQKTPAR